LDDQRVITRVARAVVHRDAPKVFLDCLVHLRIS
jgi:hypothetical protein